MLDTGSTEVSSSVHKPLVSVAKAAACVVVFLGAGCAFSAQIVLPAQSAAPGATILEQVAFSSQSASVSGIQFDVDYDNSVISLGATLGGPAGAAGKTLYAVDLAPNTKRFLIVGSNRNSIPNGTLINLFVTMSSTAASGPYALTLANVYGTDSSGDPTPITSTNGTVSVIGGAAELLQSNGVLSGGSFLPGPVAPGELITLFGSRIGPVSAQTPNGSASNTSLGGTSVLFDGTVAPLLYGAQNQINAIVPFGVSGKAATQLTVTAQGKTIAGAALPVAAVAPAIFTLNSSGAGAGAILNQDLSVNSTSNPAAKGSVIAIFVTGLGQTNPPSVDGQVTGSVLPAPILSPSVKIGGLDAKVEFAGAASGLVAGVMQVNALVPSSVGSGPAVPVVLSVGGASSRAGVTVAIR
jgi:uncharacterized protein (TIGR03437 family)